MKVLNDFIPDPLNRNAWFAGVPFFGFGALIRQHGKDIHIGTKKLIIILGVSIIGVICEFFFFLPITTNLYLFSGMITISTFLLALNSNIGNNILSTIGREHSFFIYALHPFVGGGILGHFLSFKEYQMIYPFLVFLLSCFISVCLKSILRVMQLRDIK